MKLRHQDFTQALRQQRLSARRAKEARRGRLGPARFDAFVSELAGVMRLAFDAGTTGSLFGLEGALRHAIRSELCLYGWRWHDADAMARDLMDGAFWAVRARRPTWNEGQPEWTVEAGTLIERTRCARCGAPLPEGHHKFCSSLCARAHQNYRYRINRTSEAAAVAMATRLI